MIQTVAKTQLAVRENLVIQKKRYENGTGRLKRLSIVTGTHGDELEGQYVCFLLGKLFSENPEALDGIVDLYPALNPLGIDSITRGIPLFDLDMNRIFPGSNDGATAEQIAAEIIDDLLGSDLCIDIHSSNIYLREIPQIRMSVPTAPRLLPYAKKMNVDFVWVHESATVLESTLAHSLNTRGTGTLVVEMGVGMRITPEYCHQLVDGILNLMASEGMWKLPVREVHEPVISMDGAVDFINAPAGGIFIPAVTHGQIVKAGQHLGDIADPLSGTVTERIEATCNGWIFTLREYPVVYGGSLLARILKGAVR